MVTLYFSSDGCSNECLRETGYQCLVTGSPCTTVCGDAIKMSMWKFQENSKRKDRKNRKK